MFLQTINVLDLLLPLALILLLSKLLQMGCKKVKLPQVVGMLLAGIIIGFIKYIPNVGDFVLSDSARDGIKFLAEIGVVLIMFSAGLETNIQTIKSSGISAIVVTSLGVIVPMSLGFVVASLFNGWENVHSNLFYGVILTATSVSVTVATLKELHRLSGKVGTIIVSAAILDDIIGVVVLSVVLSLSGTKTDSNTLGSLITCKNESLAILAVFLDVILFFIFVIVVGILVHKLFKYLNKKMPHTRRIPIFSLVFCFIMAWASETLFGIADITGAYFAGLSLAGIGHHINPISDKLSNDTSDYIERKSDVLSYMLFSPIFFANVGLNIDFSSFNPSLIGLGCSFILAGLLGKVIGCGIGAKITHNSWKDSLRIGVGMMARAEVALICATKGMNAGLVDSGMSVFVVIMIIVSSFVTPLVLKATYKNETLKEDYEEEKFTAVHEAQENGESHYVEGNVEP